MTRFDDHRAILEPSRLKIVQVILATDWASLSVPEIVYRVPLTKDEVVESLHEMMDRERPFIVSLDVPVEHREPNLPDTFYAVSEYGVQVLKEVRMYSMLTVLYQVFVRLEPPEHIRAIEEFSHRPVPEWI